MTLSMTLNAFYNTLVWSFVSLFVYILNVNNGSNPPNR